MSAHWKTILADDSKHQKYPRVITIKNEFNESVVLTWDELYELMYEVNQYKQNYIKAI